MFFRAESGLGNKARSGPNPSLPGSWSVDIRLIGPLWQPAIFKSVVDRAALRTVRFGKATIQRKTPVDTRNLRNQWMTSERTIYNDEYYANFVEYGTIFMEGAFMATDSTKEIENYFIQQIGLEIRNQIATPVGTLFSIFK